MFVFELDVFLECFDTSSSLSAKLYTDSHVE